MKLTSLYIKAFGKLKDFEYNFNDGLNCIYESNSFGKSTIAQFVKAVFYGLNYTKKDRANDVDFYRPWDFSGAVKYGGFVVFEVNSKQYKLERYFGDTQKQEQVIFTDLSTAKQLDTANVGQRILGLTAESFERSAFVPQEEVSMQNSADLEQKLSRMMDTSDGGAAIDKAEDKLREYSKSFKYERGNGGKIFELSTACQNLEQQIYICKKNLSKADQLKAEISYAEQQSSQIKQQVKLLEEKTTQLTVAATKSQVSDETMADLNQVKQFFVGKDYLTLTDDTKIAQQLHLEVQDAPKPSKLHIWLFLASIIFAGAAVAFFVLSNTLPAICLSGGAAVILIVAVMFWLKSKSQNNILKAKQSKLEKIFLKYMLNGSNIDQNMQKLWQLYNQFAENSAKLQYLTQQTNSLAMYENAEKIKLQLSETAQQMENFKQKLAQLQLEIGQKQQERQTLLDQNDLNSLMDEFLLVKQQLDSANYCYHTAQQTLSLLRQAKENLSVCYLPSLSKKCSQLMHTLSGGDFENVVIDKDFNISITENQVTKPSKFFSRGIKELAAFCFRLALTMQIFDNIPFLMLDDVFVNLDEKNFKSAIKLLKSIAESTQIIYFTCHQRANRLV